MPSPFPGMDPYFEQFWRDIAWCLSALSLYGHAMVSQRSTPVLSCGLAA